jgi:hypothetical protein
MKGDDIVNAITGRKVSRRHVLQSAATLTAGVVTARSVALSGATDSVSAEAAASADHDPVSGEIFDRDRHHRWDTV